jgi:hypothetical protein
MIIILSWKIGRSVLNHSLKKQRQWFFTACHLFCHLVAFGSGAKHIFLGVLAFGASSIQSRMV